MGSKVAQSGWPSWAAMLVIASCGGDAGRRDDGGSSWTGITASDGDGGTGIDPDGDGDGGGVDGGDDNFDVGPAGPDGTQECAEVSETATVGPQPADIIVVIDNSNSMDAEANFVRQHMNDFSQQIIAAAIDVHVVLISAYPDPDTAGVCIDPPLGGGGCPGSDDNPPGFIHIPKSVGSHNGLQRLLDHYPDYAGSLRATAAKHVIIVTDDDSDLGAQAFMDQFVALSPSLQDFTFHGIVADEDPITACLVSGSCCLTSAAEGKVYKNLINQTGGVYGNLCDQEFQPIVDQVAMKVIGGATLACEYDIPPPPQGETFDRDKVNVEFDDGQGGTLQIGRVDDVSQCANVTDGWYYDDPNNPTKIIVCPQTCDTIQGFATASIRVLFGCATIPAG
jgi:hypothetical protein